MLMKHTNKYGKQWDRHLHGVLWAYRNTAHESTRGKPCYLLFGCDCKTSREAALLLTSVYDASVELSDYCKELTESLEHVNSEGSKTL